MMFEDGIGYEALRSHESDDAMLLHLVDENLPSFKANVRTGVGAKHDVHEPDVYENTSVTLPT